MSPRASTTRIESEAAEWINGLSPGMKMCRAFAHPWDGETADWIEKERAWRVGLRCARCGLPKVVWLDQSGRPIEGGGYRYNEVPGYLMPKDAGGFTPAVRGAVKLSLIEDWTRR
jgi:hypothetical protein